MIRPVNDRRIKSKYSHVIFFKIVRTFMHFTNTVFCTYNALGLLYLTFVAFDLQLTLSIFVLKYVIYCNSQRSFYNSIVQE